MWSPAAPFSITNDGESDAEYALHVFFPVGSMENPDQLNIGPNSAVIDAGAGEYYYNWTAEEDGTLTITMPSDMGWQYAIGNMTTGVYGDIQWSDSDPIVNPAVVEVAKGDVIEVKVLTYDAATPWAAPAGTLTFTAAFEVAAPAVVVEFGTKQSPSMELRDIVYFQIDADFVDYTAYDFTDEAFLSNFKWLIWKTDADSPASAAEATIDNNPDIVESGASYISSTNRIRVKTGVPACEMNDALTWIVAYENADGSYTYGQFYNNYRPATRYLMGNSCYNSGNAKLKALAVALLNYGAKAQVYFNHDVENLMNANLTAAEQALTWDGSLIVDEFNYAVDASKEAGIKRNNPPVSKRTIALNLVSTIDYAWEFTLSGIEISGTPTIYYWSQDQYKSLDELTLDNAMASEECELVGGVWKGYYEGRAASQMFEEIYGCLVVTDTAGNTYYSGVLACSPQRYCSMNVNNANVDLANLVKCIVIYGNAAYEYFGY